MDRKGILYASIVVVVVSLISIVYYAVLYFSSEPVIDFDYKQVAITSEVVTFSNNSTNKETAIGWQWDFGDQSAVVSSLSAKHAFPAPGRFVVTLSVPSGDKVLTKQKIIQIIQPKLEAAFDIDASSLKIGDSLKISNYSQNASDYIWFLGDGRTAQGEHPSITYQEPGNYKLSLVAINSVGQSDQYNLNVSIQSANKRMIKPISNEVIVKHIPIFNQSSLSEALTQLANTALSRSEKRKVRNDIIRDVSSINIFVNELSLENYLNKIQLEASRKKVSISVTDITRDAGNKISSITVN